VHVVRVAPVRGVDEIERLGAELQAGPLVNRKPLEQPQVPVLVAGTIKQVADPLRVERPRRGRGEDRRAVCILHGEPLSWVLRTAGRELTGDGGGSFHYPVLAADPASEVPVLPRTGVIGAAGHAARQTGLELGDAADLPAADQLAGQIGAPAEK